MTTKKNPASLSAALRSKHIRTLEVLQTIVDENEALKVCSQNGNIETERPQTIDLIVFLRIMLSKMSKFYS